MGLTGGAILIALGVALVLLSMPRRGEDVRPFVRGAFAFSLIPAVCLALITFGVALIITNL